MAILNSHVVYVYIFGKNKFVLKFTVIITNEIYNMTILNSHVLFYL